MTVHTERLAPHAEAYVIAVTSFVSRIVAKSKNTAFWLKSPNLIPAKFSRYTVVRDIAPVRCARCHVESSIVAVSCKHSARGMCSMNTSSYPWFAISSNCYGEDKVPVADVVSDCCYCCTEQTGPITGR